MFHRLRQKKLYSYLKHITRFYSQPRVSLSLEDVPQLSTLFVPGKHGAAIYQIVKPLIDIKYINDNLNNLKFSCEQREIHLDLDNVLKLAEEWLHIRHEYLAIVEKCKENVMELHLADNEKVFKVLNKKKNEIVDKMNDEKKKLHAIEDIVMPLFQKIPHILHSDAPLQISVIENCQKPTIFKSETKSHSQIAKKMLHFESNLINSYYMTGKLSVLEFAIQLFFTDKLYATDFCQLSCMDFCKSFILESIGYNPYSSIKIKEKGSNEVGQKLHLVGGASFEAFCVYFTNMNINKATLPMKYFSIGRRYNAANTENNFQNLFSVVQSTNVHYIAVSESASASCNSFNLLLNTIQEWYSELNLPFRIVNVAAKFLTIAESQRKQLELWSPALRDYIPVAYVSQHDDFVSKRIQFTYGIEHIKEGYCHIAEGEFVNIPVLIGCIIENLQTSDHDFNIPSVLQKYTLLE